MSTVIKSYISIVLIVLATFIFAGIISVTIDVQNARDYHSAVINEIENSNHNGNVIQKCKDDALANGYTVITQTYVNDSNNADYRSTITKVTLKYEYSIGLLSLNSEKEIIGYAR